MVDVGGRRWICRLALFSNSDVVGPISLWCLGSLAGGLSSGVRPLHQNTPFLWQSSCSGCDAFDHPAAFDGYSYKLDSWTCADTTKQEVRGMTDLKHSHPQGAALHITLPTTMLIHLTEHPHPLSRTNEGPERVEDIRGLTTFPSFRSIPFHTNHW